MTAEIVNLRAARKLRAREEKTRIAAENRAQYGQSKAVRTRIATERARDAKHLDGHKNESNGPGKPNT